MISSPMRVDSDSNNNNNIAPALVIRQKYPQPFSMMYASSQAKTNRDQHSQLAPLASLDCSITEPTNGCRASTVTDTPTLSDYFESDQLSDMVDDSLFEITNTGCLSKSVFTNQSIKQSTRKNSIDADFGDDNDDGQTTPTNERASKRQTIQFSLLTNHQPYDYSSTSTVPAHGRKNQQVNHSSLNAPHRVRGKSTRLLSSTSVQSLTTKSQQLQSQQQLNGDDLDKKERKPRRKAKSKPDMRQDPAEQHEFCSDCGKEATILSLNNQTGKPRQQKRNRFSFGLFNLFTSNTSASNATDAASDKTLHLKNQHRDSCHLKSSKLLASKPDESQRVNRIARTRPKNLVDVNSGVSPRIRSRDSIKVTNQRKQRNSISSKSSETISREADVGLRLSKSYIDIKAGGQQPPQLDSSSSRLCDLEVEQSIPLRPTQLSSAIDYRSTTSAPVPSLGFHQDSHSKQRSTKSVKFMMPDKMMMMRPSSSSNKTTTLGSSILPASDLLPSAPIIKRAVPKSSSYSQTESSKNLDELLAKYEDNNELIKEINEKLKLTETIASPISVIDQLQPTTVTISTTAIDNSNQNRLFNHQLQLKAYGENSLTQDNQLMSSCDIAADPSDVHRISATQSLCDTDAAAGFSRDWLNKQRAVV